MFFDVLRTAPAHHTLELMSDSQSSNSPRVTLLDLAMGVPFEVVREVATVLGGHNPTDFLLNQDFSHPHARLAFDKRRRTPEGRQYRSALMGVPDELVTDAMTLYEIPENMQKVRLHVAEALAVAALSYHSYGELRRHFPVDDWESMTRPLGMCMDEVRKFFPKTVEQAQQGRLPEVDSRDGLA